MSRARQRLDQCAAADWRRDHIKDAYGGEDSDAVWGPVTYVPDGSCVSVATSLGQGREDYLRTLGESTNFCASAAARAEARVLEHRGSAEID